MGLQRTKLTKGAPPLPGSRSVLSRADHPARAAEVQTPAAWLAGASLGRFRVLSQLAVGGTAELWLAHERDGQGGERKVVLKTTLASAPDSREQLTRFEGEASIGFLLDHPNIVRIHDCGRLANRPFIAMEYIDGLNLRQIGQRFFAHGHNFPPRLLLTVITGICRGLHAAHELRDRRGPFNFLHRDLSPENIMVARRGPTKLIDFGAAVSRHSPGRKPRLVGKVRYVAPERISGTSEDRRGDVYSLGVVLYEYLTGTPPFAGNDDPSTAALILQGQLRPPRDLAPQLLPELARITCKALASAPDYRYATAAALASDLLPVLESHDLQPSPDESHRLLRLVLAPA